MVKPRVVSSLRILVEPDTFWDTSHWTRQFWYELRFEGMEPLTVGRPEKTVPQGANLNSARSSACRVQREGLILKVIHVLAVSVGYSCYSGQYAGDTHEHCCGRNYTGSLTNCGCGGECSCSCGKSVRGPIGHVTPGHRDPGFPRAGRYCCQRPNAHGSPSGYAPTRHRSPRSSPNR
jgi:hypothetical protein